VGLWWALFFFGKVDGLGTNAIRRADDVNVYRHGSLGGGSVDLCFFIGIWFSWRRASSTYS